MGVYPRIWSTHITTPPPSSEAGSSKPRKSHRKKFPQKIPKIPTTIQKFLNITNYVCPWDNQNIPKIGRKYNKIQIIHNKIPKRISKIHPKNPKKSPKIPKEFQ